MSDLNFLEFFFINYTYNYRKREYSISCKKTEETPSNQDTLFNFAVTFQLRC